jgi:hypothetical protein
VSSNRFFEARARAFPIIAAGAALLFAAVRFYPAWFAPKDIGIGFKPVTWQGWAVSIVVIATVVLGLRAGAPKGK